MVYFPPEGPNPVAQHTGYQIPVTGASFISLVNLSINFTFPVCHRQPPALAFFVLFQ
jgi:hypothetical protein